MLHENDDYAEDADPNNNEEEEDDDDDTASVISYSPSVAVGGGGGRGFRPCPVCQRIFRNRQAVMSHMKVHDGFAGEKPYVCGVCKKTFASRSYFRSV